MRPVWLIESGVYGDEATPMLREIRNQGMIGDFVPHQSLRKGVVPSVAGQTLTAEKCVIGYGTFPFARQIQLHHRWVPGAWCSEENLDCETYLPFFDEFLLNRRHTILSGVEAIRLSERLFDEFGKDDRVFARPTSVNKLFVGRCIERQNFASALAPTRYDPATRVVIASPQEIAREWRLAVVDGRVISGCQYAIGGDRAITADCPTVVREFAESMLKKVSWRPDPAFMLDVCEADGGLRLVELNSFSSSWLYQCELRKVIAAASELAARLWANRGETLP